MKAINIHKLGFFILGMVTVGFLLGLALQAEAQVPFTISGSFPVSSGAGAVVTGDFNSDGKVDLVVASRANDVVSLLLGNGAGSFGAPTTFTVGNGPVDLTAGDFYKDGMTDLAVANEGPPGTVSILLGTDTGSIFDPKTDYGVGSTTTRSVAAGDLDNDTILDLATANYTLYDTESEYVSILLGTGDGSFAAATNTYAGPTPGWVEMGDLDGDYDLDLIVANVFDNTVSILLGAGNGSFGSPTDFAAGPYPVSLALGDVDGDGDLDIAIANDSTDYVTILLGDGHGSFAAGAKPVAGQYPRSVSMSDFDGDGNLDLLVGRQFNSNDGDNGSNAISLLLGDGTGSFGSPVTIFSLSISTGAIHVPYMAIDDFNGDQKPDIAVADTSDNHVTILLNNPVRAMPWIPLLLLGD